MQLVALVLGTFVVGVILFSRSPEPALAIDIANAAELEELGVLPAQDIPVVGQVNGHAINLLFDLGDGKYVFGVGTAQSDLNACNGSIEGIIGGPAVGPEPGDRGDWAGGPRLILCVPGGYCVVLLW